MAQIAVISTTRTDYSAKAAASRTVTVADFISMLEGFEPDTPIVFSNDNGYTYGRISEDLLSEECTEEEEEEEE